MTIQYGEGGYPLTEGENERRREAIEKMINGLTLIVREQRDRKAKDPNKYPRFNEAVWRGLDGEARGMLRALVECDDKKKL